jgi:hypothetical protein
MIGVKHQFEKEREEHDSKIEQLTAYQEAEIANVKQQVREVSEKVDISNVEITNAVVAVREDVNAIQERLSKVEGASHELVHLNSSVQQIQQKLDDNAGEASRQIEQEVGIVSERGTEENHESSLGFVENATVCVVETLRPRTDKNPGSELTKKADVTCFSIDTYGASAQGRRSNVDPKDLQEKDLGIMVGQSKTINVAQKSQLFKVPNKFFPSFTERPGKSRLFKYQCQANFGQFSRSFSRRVPFALRPAVRFRIQNMIKEGLIKEICQKSPDEPLREDLPSTILKAHAKVRKKVESRKFRRRKVKFKWQCQIRDQVSQKLTSLGY